MKKKIVLLLPLLFSSFMLSSCQKEEPVSLTYGTYLENDVDSLKELTNSELFTKSKDENEVFILAVYQDQYSSSCFCWTTFKKIIATYINTYHEQVYLFNAYNQENNLSSLGIEKYEDSTPLLYVFNGETQLARFSYKNNQDRAIFGDLKGHAMYERIHKYVSRPFLYYVDEYYLNLELANQEEIALLFMRRGCVDCSYVLPNVILPYIHTHKITKDIWLFDLQDYYDMANKEDADEKEKVYYQDIKDTYGLSEKGSVEFGYQNGVVPTLQYRQNAKLIDATVYFNDVIAKKEDGSYYISDSYYSNERKDHLAYLNNCASPTVLKGMIVNEGVIETKSGTLYWAQEYANQYHQPLLEAFLDYYVL